VVHAGHELPGGGPGRCCQVLPGVAEVVEVQVGAAGGEAGPGPVLLEQVGADGSALLAGEHRGFWCLRREGGVSSPVLGAQPGRA
jgi:hypothetical protein